MKTLPLDDPAQAADYASSFNEAGVDQLVHTQPCESVDDYRRVIDALEVFVLPRITD